MSTHQHQTWYRTPDDAWEAKTLVSPLPARGPGLFMAVVAREKGRAELLPAFRYGPYLTEAAALADAPAALRSWMDFYQSQPAFPD